MSKLKKQIDPERFKQVVEFHKGHLKNIAIELGVSMGKVSTFINDHYKHSEIEALRNTRVDRMR